METITYKARTPSEPYGFESQSHIKLNYMLIEDFINPPTVLLRYFI